MLDFKINASGDIVFEEDLQKRNPLELIFKISKSQPVLMSFSFYPSIHASEYQPSVTFSLGIKEDSFIEGKVKDEQAIEQQALMLLKTALGEISHDTHQGSRLELLKHKNLISNAYLQQAALFAEEALEGLIPNVKVGAYSLKSDKGVCTLRFDVQSRDKNFSLDWSV